MRKWMEKWGSALGALVCAAVIIFAALYTRQDELRARAAQNAASSQNQTLEMAQNERQVCRPTDGQMLQAFQGAYRNASGFWQMRPYVLYAVFPHQEVCAVQAGEILHISAQSIEIAHQNGLISRYTGQFSTETQAGVSVACGQRIARIKSGDTLQFSLLQGGVYIDPEVFFLSRLSKQEE